MRSLFFWFLPWFGFNTFSRLSRSINQIPFYKRLENSFVGETWVSIGSEKNIKLVQATSRHVVNVYVECSCPNIVRVMSCRVVWRHSVLIVIVMIEIIVIITIVIVMIMIVMISRLTAACHTRIMIMSCRTVSYRVVSCRIMSYRSIYYTIQYYTILSYHITPHNTTPHHSTSSDLMSQLDSCYIRVCYRMPYHNITSTIVSYVYGMWSYNMRAAMIRYYVLCYVRSCCDMLRYGTTWFVVICWALRLCYVVLWWVGFCRVMLSCCVAACYGLVVVVVVAVMLRGLMICLHYGMLCHVVS